MCTVITVQYVEFVSLCTIKIIPDKKFINFTLFCLKEQFLQTILLAAVALESKTRMVGVVKCECVQIGEHIQIQKYGYNVHSSGLL